MSEPNLDPQFVEREYNNRDLVPTWQADYTRWSTQSASARAALTGYLDVRYGNGPNCTLDLFPAKEDRALHIFIHGGYWRAMDKKDFSLIAPAWVARGVSVAVLNYDLCPTVTVGNIIDECALALEWLARHAARLGASTQRWLLSGHSAGGHLTAHLMSTGVDLSSAVRERLVGAVSVSGIHDMRSMLPFSANETLKMSEGQAMLWSPVRYAPATSARVLAVAGGLESSEFHRQAQLLCDAWPAVADSPQAMIVPAKHHFDVIDDLGREGAGLFNAACRLAL